MDLISSKRRPRLVTIICQALLWDQPLSNFAQYMSLALMNIHCVFILISFQFEFLNIDNQSMLVKSLQKVSKNIILKDIVNFGSHNQVITAIVSLVLIYILCFVVLYSTIIWSYYQNKKPNLLIETFCIIFAQFHLSIGFWALNAFLMDFIRVSTLESSKITNQDFLLPPSVLLIISNYLFAAFFSLCSYDPFISSNALSSFTPVYQVLTTLFKMIAAPFIFFSSSSSISSVTQWSFVLASMIIFTTRQYHLLSRFSYYKYFTMRFCVILSTTCCLLVFLIFIALAINSKTMFSSQSLLFTQLLLTPFVVYTALERFQKTLFQYLGKEDLELKTPEDTIKKIFAIQAISENVQLTVNENIRKNSSELGFWGLLKMNNFLPPNHSTIPYKAYNQFLNEIIEKLLANMVQKFQKNARLRVLQIHFGLNMNKHVDVLTFYLGEFAKPCYRESQFLSYKLAYKLQENMDRFLAANKEEIIDIRHYIEQENVSDKFSNAIKESIEGNINFWKEYLKSKVNIRQLFIQSKALEERADFIENIWNKHSETNRLFALSFYTIYCPYLGLLKAAPFQAYKLAEKYASFKREEIYRANEDGFVESTLTYPNVICIHACINRESPGKVLKVTSNIIDLLGRVPQELIGQNVSLIMPEFMAQNHQKILVNHLKSLYHNNNKPVRMHQSIPTFILHKSGHIVPCDIYLTFHPEMQENPVYIGFIKVKEVSVEKILFNIAGDIEGFTKDIGESFGLTNGAKINLHSFCTNFSEVKKAMQQSLMNSKGDGQQHQFLAHFQLGDNNKYTFSVEMNLQFFNLLSAKKILERWGSDLTFRVIILLLMLQNQRNQY